MAGNGPAPKEVRQRARDNKRTELTYDGVSVWGDDLPADIPQPTKDNPDGVLKWHPMTLAWWDAWRRWPMLEGAHPVSWNYLLATALMVNQMWNNGRWDFAAEIRLREGKFGATPADLRSLGYDYQLERPDQDDETPHGPGTVTDIRSRRERLTDTPAKKAAPRKRVAKKAPVKKAVAKTPVKKAAARAPVKKTAVPRPPY